MSTLTRVRVWLVVFVIGLVVSGVTAFPLEAESRLLVRLLHADWSPAPEHLPVLVEWIDHVHRGIVATNDEFPFLAYGTDWLAFAHLVIAIAFWGPYRDPVRNIWVVHFGMISCVAIVPLALIAGPVRGIPWWWQLIDISFGVFGIIPLLFAHRGIRQLAAAPPDTAALPDTAAPSDATGPADAPVPSTTPVSEESGVGVGESGAVRRPGVPAGGS
ncbi:hypothetical protein [Micromonospora sp. NBC_01796]|uniref:hypothetical protein n=1 Tax=Micromonospora sp. NBC_01796 TaxID=2975987 RepID=UPI002DD9EF4B|nr:hypothetical protein [Micromonospora sp. NBC_01796]WSA86569.1 hypothetical protein OIE47_02795 [Micromonospora sp. NBC_01796]